MLARKVFKASAVLGVARILARGLDMVSALVIARFLTPGDFGIVTLATATLMILRAITDLSINETIIRERDLSADLVGTAFTMSALRGLVLASVMVAMAWPVAHFYEDQRLIALLCVLALSPLIGSLSSPMMIGFARSLNYTPTAALQIGTKVASFLASVSIAYATHSYWALVVALVLPSVLSTPLSYIMAPYRPMFTLSRFRQIFSFAGWITLSRFLTTANGEADRFVIGGMLSNASLGQFAMARGVATTVSWAIGMPIMQGSYPGFANIRDEPDRLRSAYLRTQALLVATVMPLGMLLAIFAEPLVRIMLGVQWLPAVPIIQALAPMGALATLAMPVYSVAMALGRVRQLTIRDLVLFLASLPAVAIGCWSYGLFGAVAARLLVGIANIVISIEIAGGLLGLSIRRQLFNCWRPLLAVVGMSLYCLFVMGELQRTQPAKEIVELALVISSALTGYCLIIGGLWLAAGRPRGAEEFVWSAVNSVTRRWLNARASV